MEAIADTTYLIDLWRESGDGPATRFAVANPGMAVGLPWVAVGEFLAGAMRVGHRSEAIRAALSPFIWVHSTAAIVAAYARLESEMRSHNAWIGSPDTWIAACAVALGLPLLTRNRADFERVSGLQIVDYAGGDARS